MKIFFIFYFQANNTLVIATGKSQNLRRQFPIRIISLIIFIYLNSRNLVCPYFIPYFFADMKDKILIVETANSAAGMRKAAPAMAKLGLKLMKGEELGASIEEGYLPNGIRKNFFEKERGAKRAVKMLLAKLNDKPFVTEFPMPDFDRVEPGKAIADMSKATVALCTSGGTVPKGNPDHIESSSASHYGEYDIEGIETLTADAWETAHGGYDPVYANDEPNRVLPVDVLRQMEREGKIGKLHRYFYTTVGNGTAVASSKKFAAEYAQKLLKAGVHAVIMTST